MPYNTQARYRSSQYERNGCFVSSDIDICRQKMLYLPTYFMGLQAALGPAFGKGVVVLRLSKDVRALV